MIWALWSSARLEICVLRLSPSASYWRATRSRSLRISAKTSGLTDFGIVESFETHVEDFDAELLGGVVAHPGR